MPHSPTTTRIRVRAAPALLAFLTSAGLACAQGAADDRGTAPDTVTRLDQWPAWRGPLGTGASTTASPPLTWSESENVRWKTPLPGLGHSSPVVWGERVFLTTAVPFGEPVAPPAERAPGAHDNLEPTRRLRFVALAVARTDGRVLWERALHEARPHAARHVTGSHASASPVTDGEVVIASFGSQGLFGLSVDGDLLWERRFDPMRVKHDHGEGSSPALFGDAVVVAWDHEGPSFLAALHRLTGEELWRVPRDEPTSWASPLVVEHDGRAQVIVAGTQHLAAHDLLTGERIWQLHALSHNVVATPVAADGMVYAGSSYEKQAFVAVRLDGARGDLAGTDRVAWYRRRSTPYVPSPVLAGEWLTFLHHYQGVLSRVHGPTGEEPARPVRLDGIRDVYASPVAAAGRIYVVDRSGETVVVRDDAERAVLARNRLDDRFSASPALAGGDLFLRGERFLYCLGEGGDAR